MRVIIAGGSGFIGRHLEKRLITDGHEVRVLTRSPKEKNDIYWDGKTLGDWAVYIEDSDVLINLAGQSVDCRYNEKNKKTIYDSRLDSTSILGKALNQCSKPPKIWINSSTATIYRHAEDRPMDEIHGEIGAGFSVDVATKWEKVFFDSYSDGIRKVALRTAIVMGSNGGAYNHFRMLTKMGFGGRQGIGNQMVSWVHEEDVCRAIVYIIERDTLKGVFNISSPNPLTNVAFMSTFREVFKMKYGLQIREWMLSIGAFFLQTETELLLKSRWVLPTKLTNAGFTFKYNNIKDCLTNLKNEGIL